MSYNTDHLRTAGKITVYTAMVGVLVFAVAFISNLGIKEVSKADAQQSATTSVTVTPPTVTPVMVKFLPASLPVPVMDTL